MRPLLVHAGAWLLRRRWFVRAPILVFRLRLGWLFAGRVLLLEHRGRVSGRRRYVTLECVERPDPRTVYVASGFGERSQWYRNVAADPRVRVSIGFLRLQPARATLLDHDASQQLLDEFGRAHGAELAELDDIVRAARADHRADLRMVRLDLDA